MRYPGHFYFLFLIITGSNIAAVLDKYVSLISDVHEFYGTSSVFFISSTNYRRLEELKLVHVLSRDFSRKGVLSLIINFGALGERTDFYRERILRPLIVVLLKVVSDIDEFNENTRKMNVSYPIWLVIFVDEFGAPLCEHCKNPIGNIFNLRFDTEMLIVCCRNPVVKEWWHTREDTVEMADFAIWLENEGFKVLTNESLYARRHEVSGTNFRIALVTSSAFLHIEDTMIRGFFGDVLSDLKFRMNFTVSAKIEENRFGSYSTSSKNWSGVVGQIAERQADLGVAEFTITNDRLNVVDFTLPLVLSRNRLYIKEPDNSGVQWSSYFQAFTVKIWLAIIILIITSPLLLTVIKMRRGSNVLASLYVQNYLHVWGIFCQQGLSEFPVETPLRLAYFSIFVSALVVSAAYSASLISFLTVASTNLPFTTLDGFAEDGTYDLIVYQNSSDYDLFAISKDPVLSKMMTLMRPWNELPTTLEQGFGQVCKEKVAFYTTEAGKQTMNVRLPCKVAAIDSGRTDSLAMIMPLDNQYTGVVNYHVQRFQDNGMLNRLKEQYFTVDNPAEVTHDVVTPAGVAPILAVLAGGMILSLVILLLERYYSSRKNNNRNGRQIDTRTVLSYRWINNFRKARQIKRSKILSPVYYPDGAFNRSLIGYYP